MKITSDKLQFASLEEFIDFIEALDLSSEVELDQPILDIAGNVLLKEKIKIKPSAIEKLREMKGSYKEDFIIPLNNLVLTRLRKFIAEDLIKQSENRSAHAGRLPAMPEFVAHLLLSSPLKHRAFIHSALRYKEILLLCYRLKQDQPAFYAHACAFASLTLALSMLCPGHGRYMYTCSFIAGLIADLPFAETGQWQSCPATQADRADRAEKAIAMARNFNLPVGFADVLQKHVLVENLPEASVPSFFSDFLSSGNAKSDEEQTAEDDGIDKSMAESVANAPALEVSTIDFMASSLKIARFLMETAQNLKGKDKFAENLISIFSYTASRGYFDAGYIQPLLANFMQYQEMARHIIRIAELEKKCLFKPSAWAYPKPKTSQILCRMAIEKCPLLIKGRDLHIVTPQPAYGRIGAVLDTGYYPKCQLSWELDGRAKDSTEQSRRAIDLESWRKYIQNNPGGVNWSSTLKKFGIEMTVRAALRLYDYAGLIQLIQERLLADNDLLFLEQCMQKMEKNQDVQGAVEAFKELKAMLKSTSS